MLIRCIEDFNALDDETPIVRISLKNSGSNWTAMVVNYDETADSFNKSETVANVKEHPEHYLGNLIFASCLKEKTLDEAKVFKDYINLCFSGFRFDGKGKDDKLK